MDRKDTMHRVVIVGAGFGGLAAAKQLRRTPVDIRIVDRRNFHLFQPLLYQVATAALNPSDIAYPIRSIFRKQSNVTQVLMGDVASVDPERRIVRLADNVESRTVESSTVESRTVESRTVESRTVESRTVDVGSSLEYDSLIIATGATHSYLGHDEWELHAPGLKTVEDALEIRGRVLSAFEEAEARPERASSLLTFVVVGAGPTGVELAGALVEIAVHALAHEFDRIEPASARVVLIEGAPHVLPAYPEKLSESARRQLEGLGVDVRTGSLVSQIDEQGVTLDSGERIEAATVLWGAGVTASPLAKALGAPLDRAGRVVVAPDLSLPDHPNVFVVGDLASIPGVPGVAPAAMQQGRHAARQIGRDIAGLPRTDFVYRDKGSLATIGRARAVADIGSARFSGLPAWLAWMAIHIFFLIGFRNRLLVLFSWAWSYVTFHRGARIITNRGPGPDVD
ncbi:MAG: NAD(P)/FAD-dependent oxidoreductase [Candidatus Eisenbacteria bacterium]|uniref:NADH:ubiquinone reductase (non-electrogenic) n=1 Tax=Eiseniibacteriota bacterium TaxID=2212470 RepID=A0A956NCX9_UNCEI|nr:NAD(P)/FAD-dependent oxidoreductase [Candidatus Eisenbacteria bacterium]